MSKATIAGDTPTKRVDDTDLALTDIAWIDIFDDVGDGNGPQKIGTFPNPGPTFVFTTNPLTVGAHVFTAVVNDTKGHKSSPSNSASLDVPATLAAPKAIANLTATLVADDPSSAPAPAPAQNAS